MVRCNLPVEKVGPNLWCQVVSLQGRAFRSVSSGLSSSLLLLVLSDYCVLMGLFLMSDFWGINDDQAVQTCLLVS